MMYNWIQINSLKGELGGLDEKTIRRALALICDAPEGALDVIREEEVAGRTLPFGLSLDPMMPEGSGNSVVPTTEAHIAPAVFVLVVDDPKADFLARTHLKQTLSSAPIIVLAHMQPARSILDDLKALEASIGSLGFEQQVFHWVDISDRQDGYRHATWPKELGPQMGPTLSASMVRRNTSREQVAPFGSVLDVVLDAPWCWKEKRSASARTSTSKRPLGDDGARARMAFLKVLEEWMKHPDTGPDASITIVATERSVDPSALNPELAAHLGVGSTPNVFWLIAPPLASIGQTLAALPDAQLAEIKSDLILTAQALLNIGAPTTVGDPPWNAVRAYTALVNGQSQSLATIRPPDAEATAKRIIEDANNQTHHYAQSLLAAADAKLRLERAAPAIMSRLAVSRDAVIKETPPGQDGGRQKVSDRQGTLELTDEAKTEIARRVRDVMQGFLAGHAHLMRLHWLRNLRPRYTDQIKSQLGDPKANPRLPVIENIHHAFPPVAEGRDAHVKTLVARMKWPKEQPVPHWKSFKQLWGQFRKIKRFGGMALGLIVLVGLGGVAVSDGLNAYVGRDATVQNEKPTCPSNYPLWSVPQFAEGKVPSHTKQRVQLEIQQRDILNRLITNSVNGGNTSPVPQVVVVQMAQAVFDGKSLNLSSIDSPSPDQIFQWKVAFSRVQSELFSCFDTDQKAIIEAGELTMQRASTVEHFRYTLGFLVSILANAFVAAAMLLIALLFVALLIYSLRTSLHDQKVGKRNGIEETTVKAIQTELMASFSEWKVYLDQQRIDFITHFAEQVRATLHKRGTEATASFETVEAHLKADVAKTEEATKKSEKTRADQLKKIGKAQSRLQKNLKKAIPSGMGG